MQLTPYLNFDGRCEAAFKFYEGCLGGQIVAMLTYGSSPNANQTPPEWRDKIMHARLSAGDAVLMASDVPPEQYEVARGMSVALNTDTAEEAERIFNALSENGIVQMPIQTTFWATRFGMLIDQFGTPWLINFE